MYDIAYERYKDLDLISNRKKQLHDIGQKIYYGFQINAFLFCEDVYKYSTIHEAPEFLFTLSNMNSHTNELYETWKNSCEAYVVKFKAKLKETSVYKGYKQDKIEMRGDRAEMSDFPLYLNTVAGGLDRRNQAISGFSFVVKIYAVPVVEIIG